MKQIIICIPILWGVFLIGCDSSKELDNNLEEIEKQLINYPDSAWNLLENEIPYASLSKYNQAYYCLLLTEARHKKGMPLLESDSIIDLALNYFEKEKCLGEQARALLWKGRIWIELDKPEKAVETFSKGIHLLEQNNTALEIASKLYDELGNTYLFSGLYKDALTAYRKEYALDAILDDNRGLTFSLRNIGNSYELMNQPDSAFFYYNEALKYAQHSDDSILLSDILFNDLSIWYKNMGKYEVALEHSKKIKNITNGKALNRASIFVSLGQLETAFLLLDSIVEFNDNEAPLSCYKYLYLIEQRRKNYKTALYYFDIYKTKSDDLIQKRKNADIVAAKHLFNIDRESDRLKNRYNKNLIILSFSSVIVVSVLIFLRIVRKEKQKRKDIETENRLLERKQEVLYKEKEIEELGDEIHQLKKEIDNLKDNDFENSKKRELIFLITAEIECKNFSKKEIFEKLIQIKKGEGNINKEDKERLNREIYASFSNYIHLLKEEYPKITDETIQICCLRQAKFSSSFIGKIMNYSESAISKRVNRLKKSQVSKANE